MYGRIEGWRNLERGMKAGIENEAVDGGRDEGMEYRVSNSS